MLRTCIMPRCKNFGNIDGVSYFCITDKRRESWLKAIGRNDLPTDIRASICSDHFKKEDCLVVNNKIFIKDHAIPYNNLDTANQEDCTSNLVLDVYEETVTNEKKPDVAPTPSYASTNTITSYMEQFHNYNKNTTPPRNMLAILREKNKMLQVNLTCEKKKTSRLTKTVKQLKGVIRELKSYRRVISTPRATINNKYSVYY